MAGKKSLLNETILNRSEDGARRPHGLLSLELLAELSRHILPFVGHGGHGRRESSHCRLIGEGSRKRVRRKTVRGSVRIRIPHGDAIAVCCGRTREEGAQLTPTEDAEHGSAFDDGLIHGRRREAA